MPTHHPFVQGSRIPVLRSIDRDRMQKVQRMQEDDRDKSMFLKMVVLFVNKTAERTLEVCVSPFVILGKSYFIPVIF